MDEGRWARAWNTLLREGFDLDPVEEWTRGRSYMPICCPWIPHYITKAKQTAAQDSFQAYQTIPTLVSCSPEISILNRVLIRPDDLPYLPHNWISTIEGNFEISELPAPLFFLQAQRNEKVSFSQRMYQRISVRPTFKEMVHAEIGSLLACREIIYLSNSKSPFWRSFLKFGTKHHRMINSHSLVNRRVWSACKYVHVRVGPMRARCTLKIFTTQLKQSWEMELVEDILDRKSSESRHKPMA